jgi:hypothetical protein
VKRLVIEGKRACNKCIIAVTTVAFFLIIMMPNYSVLAYTEHGSGDKSASDTMFFRVLKGDLNVCSPNYQYNITICQMVMKDEELSPYVKEITNSTNNATSSSSYPPLSVNPEMVINEEQLQALLINSSSNTLKGVESVRQNWSSHSNDPQGKDIGKIYVDEYPQYEPLVIEQPLEETITINNSLPRPWQGNQQPLSMNNQTVSNGIHDIEPVLPKDNRQGDSIDNPKADTSNSYSSIPIGMSLTFRN